MEISVQKTSHKHNNEERDWIQVRRQRGGLVGLVTVGWRQERYGEGGSEKGRTERERERGGGAARLLLSVLANALSD